MNTTEQKDNVFPVSAVIDGITVTGEVTILGPKDISVLITSPYTLARTGRHIMLCAPYVYDRPHAESAGKACLEQLYHSCRSIEEHKEEIKRRMFSIGLREKHLRKNLDGLSDVRAFLRRQMKSGIIPLKEYEGLVKKVTSSIEDIKLELMRLQPKMLEAVTAHDVNLDNTREYIEHIINQ